ncbi:sensor histidine kinase [Candidatus Parcubacteria bacterium]|nr:sensor histidine kinase [Candidatus Parcubacteria bacterium]
MDLSRFKISGSTDRLDHLKLQNSRLIKLRWFYIGVLTLIAAISSIIAGLPSSAAKQYVAIGLVVFVLNAIFYLINRLRYFKIRGTYALMILQLALDLAVASFVTYEQGGVEARTTVLFAIPIVAAGLIFAAKIVYLVGFLSGAAYIATLWLTNLTSVNPQEVSEILVPVIFYPALFILLARLVVYLMKIATISTRDEAYDSFLALLSHQMIHPASTVRAIIDQLERTPSGSHAEIKKYINMLKRENNDLLQLLNNLLETSSEYKIIGEEEIELAPLLEAVAFKIAENYNRPNDLRLDLSKTKVYVFAVKQKLVTALVNIINNAFQYSESGLPVKITLRRSGTDALIVVEDNGPGVNEAVQKQMFHKYNVKFDNAAGVKGLGLGLYVSRKIVQAHRGSLHLFSDNIGTRVMIKLKRGKHHE